jgi:hypothetical protein
MIQKIEEYLIVGLAAIVGLLVAALKLQGSRLHKTQVQLLDQQWDVKTASAQEAVNKAKLAYHAARKAYTDAGGGMD